MRRGEIYLVDFGNRYQSNIGKTRPAVVLSAQSYLDVVEQMHYPSVLVLPLTSQCTHNPENLLRVKVSRREALQQESEIIVNWSCSVDMENIDRETGVLTALEASEMTELQYKFALYCGLSDADTTMQKG